MAVEGQTLLPGDWVAVPQSCRLGPGLYNEPGDGSESGEDYDVRACMAGVLRKRETRTVKKGSKEEGPTKKMAWIDYSSRRVRESILSSMMLLLQYTEVTNSNQHTRVYSNS